MVLVLHALGRAYPSLGACMICEGKVAAPRPGRVEETLLEHHHRLFELSKDSELSERDRQLKKRNEELARGLERLQAQDRSAPRDQCASSRAHIALREREVARCIRALTGAAHDPPAVARAEPDAFLCFTGLAAGLGAAYEFHRRAVCCYPAPQLPRRQVTPLGFIPIYSGRVLRRDPSSDRGPDRPLISLVGNLSVLG